MCPKVNVFNIEAVSLGDLKKIVIGHDGIDPGNGWFLDKVEVTTQEDGNGKTVVFPCNSWLDKYQGDGKTVTELLPESKYLAAYM
ncbi:hypothetical protein NDU88_001192 [Pleurodeles waltl]|uniref:PLAT domain-containing protein n=1 Tax=Pleurodeles waltl TaxID=8319 RepID=A0AAV7USN1_PLEWA|nr:hypothetical protein NDU88_001192 [Pleurodeles waltl]